MKVNKKITIICTLVVLIAVIAGVIIRLNSEGKANVYVSNWNGKDNRYAICQTNDEKRSKQTMVNVGQDFIQPKVWMILKKKIPKIL